MILLGGRYVGRMHKCRSIVGSIVVIVLVVGLLSGLVGCNRPIGVPYKPKGACVYGPEGIKACVDGVYEDDCVNNFKGTWYEGQSCP